MALGGPCASSFNRDFCEPHVPLILGRRHRRTHSMGFASHVRPTENELITYSGDSHLITFAPTGTGKTSGPVISNALTHPGQLIVLDMKGEIYAASAEARRRMRQSVHVLDLRDGNPSDSLNPLDLIRHTGTDVTAIARSFAAELIERTGHEREAFWLDWAESMIAGGVAWMLADCPPEQQRLSVLFDLYTGDDPVYSLAAMLDNKKVNERSARAAFASFLQLSDRETRPSVLGSTITHLRFFDSDLCRSLTDTTSLDLAALIAGEPMSLYIIVPPHRLMAYRPLLRMWLSGMILAITQRKAPPKERTLMLCDEVGNLGKIDILLTTATLMRSFGFTLWLFLQNPDQLSLYGAQAKTLLDNAGVVQVFGAKNYRLAQDLANIVGGVSADEILNLPKDEQLLLIDGVLTRSKQVRHYSDEMFRQ